MVRSCIIVQKPEQLITAYKVIAEGSLINIIRLKNKLKEPLKLIHLNLIYNEKIIGEIQIRYGNKPCNYYSNHFLYELKRADSIE